MKFKIFEYVEKKSDGNMETSEKNSDNESNLNSTPEYSKESSETKTNTTSDNSDACSESQGNKKTPENSNVNYNSKSTNERDSKTEKKLVEKNSQSTSSNNDITDGFFNKARSIDDLIDLGFEYCEIKKGFSCNLCTKYLADPSEPKMNIKYEGPRSFGDKEKLDRSFRNVKRGLKRHITESLMHLKAKNNYNKDLMEQEKIASRNEEVGMRVGRTCMNLYLKGRPYTDFEDSILLQNLNGLFMGDLNHSRKFPAAFRTCVYEEIQNRLKTFFSSHLKQTGFKPSMNIAFDKSTYKHRPRQFVAAIVVIPDSENFLQPIALGTPVCSGAYGVDFTESAIGVYDIDSN